MSYAKVEMQVVQWAEARGIVQNSNSMAQAIKTMEEVNELLEAIHKSDRAAMADAYGDILVTLIVGCATADLNLVDCLKGAYEEIKDRKGYLTPQGVFVKQV
jgi:NTP pyrophosphatase (non-canonical NTP hydrolase)